MSLDISTLFVVSICVTVLLGVFLIGLWIQDRSIRALGWWAAAYLIGAAAVMLWLIDPLVRGVWPEELSNALLFVACGMIWSGARVFRGRPALPLATVTGAIIWLIVSQLPGMLALSGARVVVSSLIITTYAILTSIDLNCERRNRDEVRIRAIAMPLMHGIVFLSPILMNYLFPVAAKGFGDGAFALFALLTLLYVVGTAFIVVVMAKERSASLLKTAALTDPLTDLLNRRGFFENAHRLIATCARKGESVTVLMFDLDYFKSINDRFGHAIGDEVLRTFGQTALTSMRIDDVVGRLGGEEFAAILPGDVHTTATVAHRVRLAFEAVGLQIAGETIGATVSIGAVSGEARNCNLEQLLQRADTALYSAKAQGRNRVATDTGPLDVHAPPLAPRSDPDVEIMAIA